VLRDVDLEQKRESLRAQIEVLDRPKWLERAQGATAEALASDRRRAQLNDEMRETEARLAKLNLTAPVDGVVVTPRVEDKVGVRLKPGDELCEIAQTGASRVRVAIDDWDLQDVAIGAPASLRLNAAPGRELKGRVISLAPASGLHQRFSPAVEPEKTRETDFLVIKAGATSSNAPARKLSEREKAEAASEKANTPFEAPIVRFDARIEIEADAEQLKPGMSGEVKIYGQKRTLGARAWRGLRNWFRSKIWWSALRSGGERLCAAPK
jgi:hypothetical protein